MNSQIRIVKFSEELRADFLEFSRIVHPEENNLPSRLEWFAASNPFLEKKGTPAGLFAVTSTNRIAGQFLMAPAEFYTRQKKVTAYFGYDFFVKPEFRSQGTGAFLFVQGVRSYQPFVGIGVTPAVEKIAQAAGIKSVGWLKKYLWINKPVSLALHAVRSRLMKVVEKRHLEDIFPEVIDISGSKFRRYLQVPDRLTEPRKPNDLFYPSRSRSFLQWRFFGSPRKYQFYYCPEMAGYFAVRRALYKGIRLLVMVDLTWDYLGVILRAAKAIARQMEFDGVVLATTVESYRPIMHREAFWAAGRPSPVLMGLPAQWQMPETVALSMADADLDFSFGEPL